jgi:hypothetical protein
MPPAACYAGREVYQRRGKSMSEFMRPLAEWSAAIVEALGIAAPTARRESDDEPE